MFLWGYAIGDEWYDGQTAGIDPTGMWDCHGIIDSPNKLLEKLEQGNTISKPDTFYDNFCFEILVMTLDRKVVCAIVEEYVGSLEYEIEYPSSDKWYFQKFEWDSPHIDR